MTPREKADAIRLAADNLERAYHSALHTLRVLDAPGHEALRLHGPAIHAAAAACDDVADALIEAGMVRGVVRCEGGETFVTAGVIKDGAIVAAWR